MTEPCDICLKFGHWKRECLIRPEVYLKRFVKTYCKAFMKGFNSSEDEMSTNPSYPGGAHGNPFYDGEDRDPECKRTMTAHRRRLCERRIEQAYLVNRLTGEEKRRWKRECPRNLSEQADSYNDGNSGVLDTGCSRSLIGHKCYRALRQTLCNIGVEVYTYP